jgi:hypothetical protein
VTKSGADAPALSEPEACCPCRGRLRNAAASKTSAVRLAVFAVEFLTSSVFRFININFPNSYLQEAAEHLARLASQSFGPTLD